MWLYPLSCSYIEGYGLSSQSIDLTFHSLSAMPQCRLTVDTAMTTQNEGQSQQSEDEDEFGFLARNDASRYVARNDASRYVARNDASIYVYYYL